MTFVGELQALHKFKPALIFNADETMLEPGSKHTKVITRASDPRPCIPDHPKSEHVTLLLTIPAAGPPLKPSVIYPLKFIPPLDNELHTQFDFSGTNKGWMTAALFRNWVYDSFIPQVDAVRLKHHYLPTEPCLFFIDGPTVHEGLDLDDLWSHHSIKLVFLPAHSSTILQPLDLNVLAILKQVLSTLFDPIPGESLTDRRNRLLTETHLGLSAALCEYHIKVSWQRSGLFPFSPARPLGSALVNSAAMPKPAPKRLSGNKRVAMDSGLIVRNGVALPHLAPSLPSKSPKSKSSPPKKIRFDVVSFDSEFITIKKS